MSIRLLRFNLQKEIIEEEEFINSAIPFKDLTDYLNLGYSHTIWEQTLFLTNASRMEGSIILDRDSKIVRVPTTPEVYEIQVKLVETSDNILRLMFKQDINDEESWTLLSGTSYESTNNELEGSTLSIKKGWRYRFVPVAGDEIATTSVSDFNFNIKGLNYGHVNPSSDGNLGNKSMAYTESGIGSGQLKWNQDGTVHNSSKNYIEFAIDHYCTLFDESDPIGCFRNQYIIGTSTPSQRVYNIMVWNPQKTMVNDVAYEEDYTQGHRPFSLSNEIGVISDRRFTGESGLSWTNYLLKSLDIVADSITSSSIVTMTAIEGEGSTTDGSFVIIPVWDDTGHGNISITGANIIIDGKSADLLGPVTLSPTSHTFSQGSTGTQAFTVSYDDDTAPYLLSTGDETFTGSVAISYTVTDPENSSNVLNKVYNLPMSVVVGDLEGELSVGATTSGFLTEGQQHDQGSTTSSSRDYTYYLTNRSFDDTLTIESVDITNNSFSSSVLVGHPDYNTSLVGVELEGQEQISCRVYSYNAQTSDSDSATITITYNSISNSTSRTMSWGITWYRQASGSYVYAGGVTMSTPSWTADEGDGGSGKIIVLTNDYRRWWSTNPSNVTNLAVDVGTGLGDSNFTISGNSGSIVASGTRDVTVGWSTGLGVGSYSLTTTEVFNTIVPSSGGPASITINEAPAAATHDITGILSTAWDQPSNSSTRYRAGSKWWYTVSASFYAKVINNNTGGLSNGERLVTLHGSNYTLGGNGAELTYISTTFDIMASSNPGFPQTRVYYFRDGTGTGQSGNKNLAFASAGTAQQVANVSNDVTCSTPINITTHTGTATISNTHADQFFTGGTYSINTPTSAEAQLGQGHAASVGSKSTSWGLGVKAYDMEYGSSYTISGAGLSDVTVNCQYAWADAVSLSASISSSYHTYIPDTDTSSENNMALNGSSSTGTVGVDWTIVTNYPASQFGVSVSYSASTITQGCGWTATASVSGSTAFSGSSTDTTSNSFSFSWTGGTISNISVGDKIGVNVSITVTPWANDPDGAGLKSDNSQIFSQDLWIATFN